MDAVCVCARHPARLLESVSPIQEMSISGLILMRPEGARTILSRKARTLLFATPSFRAGTSPASVASRMKMSKLTD